MLYRFRFHTGSIKSFGVYPKKYGDVRFDSILVRLKDAFYLYFSYLYKCFDSILVRLKAASNKRAAGTGAGFDSILVRLKEYEYEKVSRHENGFDSILVRLKGRLHQKPAPVPVSVSIPYWFD